MNNCKQCSTEISDFEEYKYGLCWSCMSRNTDIIESDPNIASIREEEVSGVSSTETSDISIIIKDSNGTVLKMGRKKKNSKKEETTVSDDGVVSKENEESLEGNEENNNEEGTGTESNQEPKTTTKSGDSKEKKVIEDEEDLKVVRESKEIITKSTRAKLRAFALINQALKETGQFELSVVLNDSHKTVSSKPFQDKNIEDVIMTTTMEVLDFDNNNKKKK